MLAQLHPCLTHEISCLISFSKEVSISHQSFSGLHPMEILPDLYYDANHVQNSHGMFFWSFQKNLLIERVLILDTFHDILWLVLSLKVSMKCMSIFTTDGVFFCKSLRKTYVGTWTNTFFDYLMCSFTKILWSLAKNVSYFKLFTKFRYIFLKVWYSK